MLVRLEERETPVVIERIRPQGRGLFQGIKALALRRALRDTDCAVSV